MLVNFVQRKELDPMGVYERLRESYAINQLTNDGPAKRELELTLHSRMGCRSDQAVVCVSSGTSACHLLMFYHEMLVKHPLRWLTPAFTFPTPVVNGTPRHRVTVRDIDPTTLTLPEPSAVDWMGFDGVIITSLFGAHLHREWVGLCAARNKLLIFDNASSPLGRVSDGVQLAQLGDASFGSLHHTKYLGFGEGGFAVVPSDQYAAVNRLACFGFDSERNYRVRSSNFKMSDVSAAYILEHIDGYDLRRHLEVQEELVGFVGGLGSCRVLGAAPGVVHGNLPVIFDRPIECAGFTAQGVEVHKYYRPLAPDAPEAWSLFQRIINFPLHAGLSDYQVGIIKNVIRDAAG